MKLLMNGMLGVTMASFAEVFVVGERAGLDIDQVLDVVVASGMGGPATRGAAEMVRTRSFEPRLSASLMLKDLRLLGELAAATRTPISVTAAAQQLFAAVEATGLGELDRAAVVLLIEKLAGLGSSTTTADNRSS
jgi:3-hydroxyisobutyrate dehydrogenase-like beta-hydroxyacid dehydrogenase